VRARAGRRKAFTLVEMCVAVAVFSLLAAAAFVFVESTGRSLSSVATQSDLNQSAGHMTEFLLQRIRLANSATSDSSGNVLTFSFDDDPTVDSDSDGMTWNDRNHYERLTFSDGDGFLSTLTNNVISYKTNIGTTYTTNVLNGYVRKISNLPIFSAVSNTVSINFGLLVTNQYRMSQMIEVRTKVRLRNKLQ
jgi:prepilin-type N-terminal cleavage/methylation domain-containing protein